MMFISTVVHIFEFILLSLLGIMLYRLFASYKKWKNLSVSSSSKGGDRSGRIVKPSLPQNPDYLSISKITVTEEKPASQPVKTKQSSVILTDYIGEFFAESKPMDLEPYRANRSEVGFKNETVLQQTDVSTSTAQMEVSAEHLVPLEQVMSASNDVLEDEIIQIKPLNLSPVILAHPILVSKTTVSKTTATNAEEIEKAEFIPTLREFVDTDTDAYITVDSGANELRANNVMSDKVVMAMLDEAKLVCAS